MERAEGMIEIRDPIHGGIFVSPEEGAVIDHPFVQRLRGIKQMGFSELPFPGAVHSRYSHVLGVMELAGRAFEGVFNRDPFSNREVRARYKQVLRLAALCHDLGHAPFSHCTEFAMPLLKALKIAAYDPEAIEARLELQASHEDYTIGILTQSSLTKTIADHFPFTGQHIAALISHDVAVPDDGFFEDQGIDYQHILSQLISSELDADRMDYLCRDAWYSGARYGQVDVPWLLSNLEFQLVDNRAVLAIDQRAIYAFDDFLLSRYHMFMMVYLHHRSVVYEELLKKHMTGPDCGYVFPVEMEEYLKLDDIQMYSYLRSCTDDWARRIVERQPFKRALELHGTREEVDFSVEEACLQSEAIPYLASTTAGKLSRYSDSEHSDILVVQRSPGVPQKIRSLSESTKVFEHYREARHIARLYVAPEAVELAQRLFREAAGLGRLGL
jgi:HD superfamily phosphohydrolase